MTAEAALAAGEVDAGLAVLHQAACYRPSLGLGRLFLALAEHGRYDQLTALVEEQLGRRSAAADGSLHHDKPVQLADLDTIHLLAVPLLVRLRRLPK